MAEGAAAAFPSRPELADEDDALAHTLLGLSAEKMQVSLVDRFGTKHQGVVSVPRRSPLKPTKPTANELAELTLLVRKLEGALAAQAEGWDAAALTRAFAPVLALVQKREGHGELAVALTRRVLSPLLTAKAGGREAELAAVPEDIQLKLKGKVTQLSIESAYLQSLPSSLNRLVHLEDLSLNGSLFGDKRLRLKELPTSIWRLTALKTLTLKSLDGLKEFPSRGFVRADPSAGAECFDSLESLVISNCENLKVLSKKLVAAAGRIARL